MVTYRQSSRSYYLVSCGMKVLHVVWVPKLHELVVMVEGAGENGCSTPSQLVHGHRCYMDIVR